MIVIRYGAFKVKRLQFDINIAPRIFQELVEILPKGIPIPYSDYVLVVETSEQELTECLQEVFWQFQTAGLWGKKEKCQSGVPQVEFLGILINASSIHSTLVKVKASHSAPPSRSKKDLQSFWGLLNFYHAFLPHKALIVKLLFEKNQQHGSRGQENEQPSQLSRTCFLQVLSSPILMRRSLSFWLAIHPPMELGPFSVIGCRIAERHQ